LGDRGLEGRHRAGRHWRSPLRGAVEDPPAVWTDEQDQIASGPVVLETGRPDILVGARAVGGSPRRIVEHLQLDAVALDERRLLRLERAALRFLLRRAAG